MRRKLFIGLCAVGVLTLGTPATHGLADTRDGPASCMGFEASALSPPGSSDESPGGMPELKRFIDENFPGIPPGVIFSLISHLHEGSHEACDEALEG
jgi:hypothetical protein